jgi:NDP-sugar pyrophosphorylase family protein
MSIETEKTTIIQIDEITEGPACSVLKAKNLINNDDPLIIANCDQIMNWNSDNFRKHIELTSQDALVVTFKSNSPQNSYVKIDSKGRAIEFAEKEVISNDCLNGIHYWKKGKYCTDSLEKMISDKLYIKGEFYISPSFNYLLEMGLKVGHYPVSSTEHYSVGTEEDLNKYLNKY